MTNKDTIDMTVSELVYEGVKEYADNHGWDWEADDNAEYVAEIIFATFGVQINYSVIDEVIRSKLSIQTTVKLLA